MINGYHCNADRNADETIWIEWEERFCWGI